MRLLQLKNTAKQKSINVKETSLWENILTKENLSKIIGGSNDGGEDDDDFDEIIEWE